MDLFSPHLGGRFLRFAFRQLLDRFWDHFGAIPTLSGQQNGTKEPFKIHSRTILAPTWGPKVDFEVAGGPLGDLGGPLGAPRGGPCEKGGD